MSANVSKPNLFIVGAMKSGTTSLHNYLGEHPEVFMSEYKEPQYFVEERNWKRGESWYLTLFEAANNERFRGESTTDYTKAPHYGGVPERISKFSPDARIIYLMRDPVERTISHYWWDVHHSMEGRPLQEAVKKSAWLTDVSYYAMQIRPYLSLFGKNHVLALTTEELRDKPYETLEKAYEFLGIEGGHRPDTTVRHNASKEEVHRTVGARFIAPLRETKAWHVVKELMPREAKAKIKGLLSRPTKRDDSGRDDAIRYLRTVQREQTAELSELIGRSFPEWTTLHGA